MENLCEEDSVLEDLCVQMFLTCTEKKGNLDRDHYINRGIATRNYGAYLEESTVI